MFWSDMLQGHYHKKRQQHSTFSKIVGKVRYSFWGRCRLQDYLSLSWHQHQQSTKKDGSFYNPLSVTSHPRQQQTDKNTKMNKNKKPNKQYNYKAINTLSWNQPKSCPETNQSPSNSSFCKCCTDNVQSWIFLGYKITVCCKVYCISWFWCL